MKLYYEIRNAAEETAEVWIYEQIGEDWWTGEGVTAKQFAQDMAALKATAINLHINSPGGLVFEGQAIYNALKNHPATITTYVDGLAASIASVIALAGDRVVMNANAIFMVHNPWGGCVGSAAEMRSYADILDKLGDTIIGVYEAKSGRTRDEIAALMDAETWMSAEEAFEFGFADEVSANLAAAACVDFDLKALGYKNAPPDRQTDTAPTEAAARGLFHAPAVTEPEAPADTAAADDAPVDELAAKRRERAYKRLSNRERD